MKDDDDDKNEDNEGVWWDVVSCGVASENEEGSGCRQLMIGKDSCRVPLEKEEKECSCSYSQLETWLG